MNYIKFKNYILNININIKDVTYIPFFIKLINFFFLNNI